MEEKPKDLITEYSNNKILNIDIEKFAETLDNKNPDFEVGQIITFYGGYNSDILYKTKIIGFIRKDIYLYWDCYWFPIQNNEKRKISKISKIDKI